LIHPIRRTRRFIDKHRFAIGVTIGFSAGMALTIRNNQIINEFLREHDLYEKYYFIPDEPVKS
jgi:hypothetical protein